MIPEMEEDFFLERMIYKTTCPERRCRDWLHTRDYMRTPMKASKKKMEEYEGNGTCGEGTERGENRTISLFIIVHRILDLCQTVLYQVLYIQMGPSRT
jgi:hypothetical protein